MLETYSVDEQNPINDLRFMDPPLSWGDISWENLRHSLEEEGRSIRASSELPNTRRCLQKKVADCEDAERVPADQKQVSPWLQLSRAHGSRAQVLPGRVPGSVPGQGWTWASADVNPIQSPATCWYTRNPILNMFCHPFEIESLEADGM